MSTTNRSIQLSARPMTVDEYLHALRCVGYGLSVDERQESIMRALEWGDISPCYMAWDQLREALASAIKGAQMRWRHARRIDVEQGAGDCTIYRVSTWAKQAAPAINADEEEEDDGPTISGFCIDAMYEEHFPGEDWGERTGFGRIDGMWRCLGYDVVAALRARHLIRSGPKGTGAQSVLKLLVQLAIDATNAHSDPHEMQRARHLLRSCALVGEGLVPVPLDPDDKMSPIERDLRHEIKSGVGLSALEGLAGVAAMLALDLSASPDMGANGDVFCKHVRAFARALYALQGFAALRQLVTSLEELQPARPRASGERAKATARAARK